MSSPPAGIPEADWLSWPPVARQFILAQQQENDELRSQLTALASELANLREQIGRSSRNSSKPPSSDGLGFKPPERRKGSGQPGHQVIEHRLHRLVCPCCSTSTCATLPADVEASQYGPRLSALVGLLGSVFPLSFSKTQALRAVRQQPVAYADGNNPTGKRGWQWVMVTAVVTLFIQGLSRSTAAAIELLGNAFGGIVVSDRFSAYNHLPVMQRQLCWAHLIRDLVAIAERPGASAEFVAELLGLQQQLFDHRYHYKEGTIDWPALRQRCRPIRQAFEARLQQVVELGYQRGERTPWAKTVRTAQQILQLADGLWTFHGDPWNRAHQQRRRACPAPVGDSTQDQSWRPISQWCRLPQPTAHRHDHP